MNITVNGIIILHKFKICNICHYNGLVENKGNAFDLLTKKGG